VPEQLEILVYEYVENVVERRAPHREAHLALARQWKDDGRMVMGGAIGDPPHGGVLVFRSGAGAFAAEDPYVAAGIVTAWRVEPWNVVV
jgi:hypothetical protein